MNGALFSKVTYSLSILIHNIDLGEIALPDIQRPFIWTPAKVRDLFDSMYKGFPVGYFLFWVNGVAEQAKQIGTTPKQKIPRLLIVDGQQRLTSLYAVLKGKPVLREDYAPVHLRIAFRPRDAAFEVTDAAIGRDPEFIADVSRLWADDASLHEFVADFFARLEESRPLGAPEKKQLSSAIYRLYDLHNYSFTAMELSSTVSEEQVAEVFVRINSKGVALNQADFILTLMSVFWDDGRRQLEQFCRGARVPSTDEASAFNHFIQPDADQPLRTAVALGFRRARLQHVYSILRGKDLETGQFSNERRVEQFEVLKQAQTTTLDLQNWHEFLKVLIRAGYRSGSLITSEMAIVYSYAIYLIGKRDYGVEPFDLRNALARWFFMATLTGRYSGSPESVMEEDLARFRAVKGAAGFVESIDRVIADRLTEDFWNITLPNDLGTSAARSPTLFAYYAALNLLDARVLFSKMKVSELLDPALKAKKAPVERHHLFAKNYLKGLGITDTKEVNQVANFALVEWTDNIDISDDPPAKYVPDYAAKFSPKELGEMYYWHALPDGWETMTYEDFLPERRRRIAKVIRAGFERLTE